jgi:hypothetical protein
MAAGKEKERFIRGASAGSVFILICFALRLVTANYHRGQSFSVCGLRAINRTGFHFETGVHVNILHKLNSHVRIADKRRGINCKAF